MTHALINNGKINCLSNVDERSSAFFGLGIARANNEPVVISSTSGTAVANFFPAVIEASLSNIPILILSADRPSKLVGTGANQTIDQKEIFGNHVRFFMDMGLPEKEYDKIERKMKKSICQLKGLKNEYPPGPVHLNFPFDEPLVSENISKIKKYSFYLMTKKDEKENPFEMIEPSKKPLIVVGPNIHVNFQNQVILLAEKINAPIMADPLSQHKYGFKSRNIISHYDMSLKHWPYDPDFILRIGSKPTSKILCRYLDEWRNKTLLIGPWIQHNDNSLNYHQSSIDTFLQYQLNNINWQGDDIWLNSIISLDEKIEEFILEEKNEHEGMIARACQESLQNNDQFIIGNSMPIRDVDAYTNSNEIKIKTHANRGASGIDGVLSTALGISYCNKKNSLLLIGDLSFYHDMNGLLASRHGVRLTIVVVNNGGGGIFSFLPIAKIDEENFKEFWTTNTGLDLKNVATLYGCQYVKVKNLPDLKENIQNSFTIDGIKIIEIQTEIDENVRLHEKFMEKVAKEISNH